MPDSATVSARDSFSSAYKSALIPIRRVGNGPLTTARLYRFFSLYLLIFLIGVGLIGANISHSADALGLGLIFPGGGFLLYAHGSAWMIATHVGLFLLTIILFAVAFLLWFGTANIIAPPAVWFGAAIGAALMNHQHTWEQATFFVPAGVILIGCATWFVRHRDLQSQIQRRDRRNQFLAHSEGYATVLDSTGLRPDVEEMSEEDLQLMRFALDRALQPLDAFEGFVKIDQFLGASTRYQLCEMSWTLSAAQYIRTPSFHGYLSQAQVNLMEKMKQHHIWKYWALENAWGNFRLDPDPGAVSTCDNVMYTGWYAAALGMFASASGDRRYDEPGSITLQHPDGREFVYDFPRLVEILQHNYENSAFTLFPCEPNWIYVLCNNYGGIGVKIHDRLNGDAFWPRIEARYRDAINSEFSTVDGRLIGIRSAKTGVTIPAMTSIMADAYASIYMHPLMPDIARRTWEIVRTDMIDLNGENVEIALNGWDKTDTGNYRPSLATTLTSITGAAREMGDTEVEAKVTEMFKELYPSTLSEGVLHYEGVSVMGHLHDLSARVGRMNGYRDLVNHGLPDAWATGPVISDAPYPDVLVAKAVSDGDALEAVLYPGRKSGEYSIEIVRLMPGQSYAIQGPDSAPVNAAADGTARLTLKLDGRTELFLHPTN